jgi:DNA-binding XRE family transcriptional regulator
MAGRAKYQDQPTVPDLVQYIDDTFGHRTDWNERVEKTRVNGEIAQLVYDLRTQLGLTQHELAERIGTKQPAIARLEDADYEGRGLSMLIRIGVALNRRVHVEFVPVRATSRARMVAERPAKR